jgi:hypothetical protein
LSLFKKTYDIIFYYPQHFNRSEKGTNPFFDPLVAVCEENRLSYLLVEEPDNKTAFPRNKGAKLFRYIYVIYFFRKLFPIILFETYTKREKFIAKILKPFFFRNFNCNNFITISNSMLSFFKGINPNAKLFDYQHGIVYSNHEGYIENKKAHSIIQECNSNVLVYGDGFKKLLVKGDKYYYKNHVYSIGFLDNKPKKMHSIFNGKIIITLQFCGKKHIYWYDVVIDYLIDLFEINKEYFIKNNIQFYLKHHPRFENNIDISMLTKYSFVEDTSSSILEISNNCSVHLTYNSTTAFEVSKFGIPTFFIPDSKCENLFFKEYKYPMKSENFIDFIDSLLILNSYNENAEAIKSWYEIYYNQLNESYFLELLKK